VGFVPLGAAPVVNILAFGEPALSEYTETCMFTLVSALVLGACAYACAGPPSCTTNNYNCVVADGGSK